MADMCPDYVMQKAKEAIDRGCVWRKARPVIQKKRYSIRGIDGDVPPVIIETKSAMVFSCCEQTYIKKGERSLSLRADENTGRVVSIREQNFSRTV